MNASTPSRRLAARGISCSNDPRLEWIALGLLLTGAWLSVLIPHPAADTMATLPAEPVTARSMPSIGDRRTAGADFGAAGSSSVPAIRSLPAVVVVASLVDPEDSEAPASRRMEGIRLVEAVPIMALESVTETAR